MKKILLFLSLLLLIVFSIEQEKHLSNNVVSTIKCIFDSKEKIELLTDLIEKLFSPNNPFGWVDPFLKLNDVFKECLNIDLSKFLPF